MEKNRFSYHVEKYFAEYLPSFIGASANTCKSYRDTFVQLLGYIETKQRVKPSKVRLETLTVDVVERFLLYIEEERGVGASTRNQRLAAIHSFTAYLQRKELSCFEQCAAILNIPFKKTTSPSMAWMSVREMEILFSIPNTSSKKGLRDLAVLVILYETGARVQELIDLTVASFHLEPGSPYVELRGKGNKLRRNPVDVNAVAILKQYLDAYMIKSPEHPIFTNSHHEKLTRPGIQHIVSKCIKNARQMHPDCFKRKYSNHSFRHSKAMHLLEAGVNLIYIRDFLGHSSVTTTEIYAKTNPEIKRKIITDNALASSTSKHYDDTEREDLMAWLKNNV